MKTSKSTCLIDWGSSNFRAWIVNPDGRLMEEYEYPVGILDPAVKDKTSWFESLIEELNFDYPNLEFLAVGMIGSATGIKNTQYSSAPCRIEEWVTKSESYVTATGRTIEIFTGIISSPDNPALVDVIRGEEFQIYTSNYADSNSVFICHLLGLAPTPWEWERFVIGHASVSRLEALKLGDGYTFSLTRLADNSHLDSQDHTY